jgi:raffinose/stachyose/melibiose transport system substrate-binding protein
VALTSSGFTPEEGAAMPDYESAMDGGDGWVLACYMQDLMVRIAQTPAGTISDAIANGDFSDPLFSEAAQLLADTASAGEGI